MEAGKQIACNKSDGQQDTCGMMMTWLLYVAILAVSSWPMTGFINTHHLLLRQTCGFRDLLMSWELEVLQKDRWGPRSARCDQCVTRTWDGRLSTLQACPTSCSPPGAASLINTFAGQHCSSTFISFPSFYLSSSNYIPACCYQH